MASVTKRFPLRARDFQHAGEASIQVQAFLKAMRLDPGLIRRIAICSYEAEMNAVIHGGNGELEMRMDEGRIEIEVRDEGPGIADIELAMQPGYSTADETAREMGFGAGMGLPNMKTHADELHLDSAPGRGTRARMIFHRRPPQEEAP